MLLTDWNLSAIFAFPEKSFFYFSRVVKLFSPRHFRQFRANHGRSVKERGTAYLLTYIATNIFGLVVCVIALAKSVTAICHSLIPRHFCIECSMGLTSNTWPCGRRSYLIVLIGLGPTCSIVTRSRTKWHQRMFTPRDHGEDVSSQIL